MSKIELVQELVTLLHLTPSGDNCRPFKFQFNHSTDELEIIYDKKIAEHILNTNEISSIITLGMMDYVLNHCDIGIIKKEIFFNRFNFDQSVVAIYQLEFKQLIINKNLKELILSRRTIRSNYDRVECDFNDHSIYYKDMIPQNLIELMLIKEDDFWSNKNIINDVFKWVHLTKAEANRKKIGLYWRDLGVTIKDYVFIALMKIFPRFGIIIYKAFAKYFVKSHLRDLYSNSSFIFFPTSSLSNESESYFNLGAFTYQKWLELTKLGYQLQPLSFYTFFKLNTENEIISEINKLFGRNYKFYWIFRVGKINPKFKFSKSESLLPIKDILRVI